MSEEQAVWHILPKEPEPEYRPCNCDDEHGCRGETDIWV